MFANVQGYCYINYSTPEAAATAVAHLNGSEFPPYTGHKIKVCFCVCVCACVPVIYQDPREVHTTGLLNL